MKVLWVADFGVQHNIGGAQRTDSLIIDHGKKLGHQITMFHHDSDIDLLYNEYDVVVSGNLEILSRSSAVMRFLNSTKYHVRFEHDSNSYLTSSVRKELFTTADKVFWLSPYHRQMFATLYGDYIYTCNSFVVPSPIDITKFKDLKNEREDKILYVGYFHPLKGTNNFLEYAYKNPNKQFVVAGWSSGHTVEQFLHTLKNVEFLGKLRHDRMPELFNKYKTLYYHPVKFEPFCRSVGEAIACGMGLNCSDNIGAIQLLDEVGLDVFLELCSNSPKTFWEFVENV